MEAEYDDIYSEHVSPTVFIGILGDTKKRAEPGYCEIWKSENREVVVLGNTYRDNGTVWVADIKSGEMLFPMASSLQPSSKKSSIGSTYHRCLKWAKEGSEDAMCWLGHSLEFGSKYFSANGAAALAFYIGYLRKTNSRDKDHALRLLSDGAQLFGHAKTLAKNDTPKDVDSVLDQFKEFRSRHRGVIHYPCSNDSWEECVRLAFDFLGENL